MGKSSIDLCYTGCGLGSTGPQRSKVLRATVTLSAPLDTSDGWLFNLVTIAINGKKPFTNPAITVGIPIDVSRHPADAR